MALWHRYGRRISGANRESLLEFQQYVPDAKRWCGYNFRYIYWLCSKKEKRELLKSALFEIGDYPTIDDLQIWIEDAEGNTEVVPIALAKSTPILKLPTRGRGETDSAAQTNAQTGGASPTRPL
jgi:hypothetical protein